MKEYKGQRKINQAKVNLFFKKAVLRKLDKTNHKIKESQIRENQKYDNGFKDNKDTPKGC